MEKEEKEEEEEVGEGLNPGDWSGAAGRGGGELTVELVRKRGWLPLSSTLRREKRARLPVCLLSSLFHPPRPFTLSLSLSRSPPLAFSPLSLADPRIPA